jgi:hypothetical protein
VYSTQNFLLHVHQEGSKGDPGSITITYCKAQ